MKLLRVGPVGSERPALLDQDGTLRDLSGLVTDVDGALLADDAVLSRVRDAAGSGSSRSWTRRGCASVRPSVASARSWASG